MDEIPIGDYVESVKSSGALLRNNVENSVKSGKVLKEDNPERSLNISLGTCRDHVRDERIKELISPSRTAQKVLLGTIMGDGCLVNTSPIKAHLVLQHGIDQLPYVIWKMQMICPIVGTFAIRMFKRNGKKNEWSTRAKVRAWTLSSKYLKHIWDDFYFERNKQVKKEVHLNVLRRLTLESLAVWYMDDGSLGVSRYGDVAYSVLATCAFTDAEQDLICQHLYDVWQLGFKPVRHKLGHVVLYADVKSTRRMIEMIKPYMCPSMMYKIDPSQSAEHLEEEQGGDMIRSLEKSKELVRNNQPKVLLILTEDVRSRLSKYLSEMYYNWATEFRFRTGVKTKRFYMSDTNSEMFIIMQQYFGGFIQPVYNRYKYSNGEQSARRMLSELGLL